MLLKIYLPVIFFGITIVFGSDLGEESSGNSANDNDGGNDAEFAVVSSDGPNPTSTAGVSSSGNEIEVHSHVKQKQRQREENMEAEMRKGKGSKKSGKGVAEDLCRKFLYVLPLLTILPIFFLIWKKHEPHYTYTHHHGHGHGGGHHGWNQKADHHQSYYKKLDDASFDYYRQPLQEQGLVA